MPIKTLDPGLRQDDDYLSRQPMSRHPGVGQDPLFFSIEDTQKK